MRPPLLRSPTPIRAPKAAEQVKGSVEEPRTATIHSKAFSLIELLTVISVLAVLAALLLPALHRAKGAAESAVCKANLGQLGIALNLYLGDFQAYPTWRMAEEGTNRWAVLRPYLDRNFTFVHAQPCPVAKKIPEMMYGYNFSGTGNADMDLGLGGSPESGTPLPESSVLVPSEMLAFLHRFMVSFNFCGFGWPGKPGTFHEGGENAAFCDGHVEACDSNRIQTKNDDRGNPRFVPDATHTKRWNRDDEPHPETWR
jgi:prepilin-type N-terminal cleavage/methylation domain-containing protein/prepilin-type processing-associated H-X9-DG protein